MFFLEIRMKTITGTPQLYIILLYVEISNVVLIYMKFEEF